MILKYYSGGEISSETSENDLSLNSEWNFIEPNKDRALGFMWETGTYTYKTSNGVTVNVSDTSDISILENKETGEVIVIGAKDAKITTNNNDVKLSVYNSDISELNSGNGNDNIRIYNSNIVNVDTGKGTDSVTVEDSVISHINTGKGDNFLSVSNSEISEINSSKGNDNIRIYNSDIVNVDTGKGIDSVTVEDSVISHINTGEGNDFISASNSEIEGLHTSSSFLWGFFDNGEDTVILDNVSSYDVDTGKGNDNLIINNSDIEELKSGKGNDSLSINNTQTQFSDAGKKDLVIEDRKYLDFDKSKISNIKSDASLILQNGDTISLNDYTEQVLSLKPGFDTQEEYQNYVIDTLTSNCESMKAIFENQENTDGIISDSYNLFKELTGLGITDNDIQSIIAEQENMINGLKAAINGESGMTFEQAYEYYTGCSYSQEKLDKFIEVSNTYSAIMTGCQYDEDYADKFKEATGKSIEDIANEYALCQLETFGKSNSLQNLVEKYAQDQESFADKLSGALSATGMGCILVGAVISFVFPPAAPIGMTLMTAGKSISFAGMFVDNGMELIDKSTDADGLTKEEAADIALETGVEAVSYVAGRKIGKFTNKLNSIVSNKAIQAGSGKIGSAILGQTSETLADTALSLGADYTIAQGESLITTGKFIEAEDYWSMDRFLGEGKNQLMGILTGVASSKVNAYQQGIISVAQTKVLDGDIEGAKNYLKTSGMKMTDASFDGFVKSVTDAEIIRTGAAAQSAAAEKTAVDNIGEVKPATDEITGRKAQSAAAEKTAVDNADEVKPATDEITETETKSAETVKPLEADTEIAIKSQESKILDSQEVKPDNTEPEKNSVNKDTAETDISVPKNSDDTMAAPKTNTDTSMPDAKEIQERYNTLISQGVDKETANAASELNNIQFERFNKLKENGVDVFCAVKAAQLDDIQLERFNKLRENGVDEFIAVDAAQLDDIQLERFIKLIKSGVNELYAPDAAQLDDIKYERFNNLRKEGVSVKDALDAAQLDDIKYEEFNKLREKGFNVKDAYAAAQLDDIKYERFNNLRKEGVDVFCAYKAASELDDIQYERFNKLREYGVEVYKALLDAIELDDIQFERFSKLAEKLCTDKELNFPKSEIAGILSRTNKDNFALVEKLCTDKELDFPKSKIAGILSRTNKDNFALVEKLCTDKELDFPKDEISVILYYTNQDNLSLAEKLCTDRELDFPKSKIAGILSRTNKDNFALVEKLCTDKELDFPKSEIAGILSRTNKDNFALVEKLCTDKELDFPKDEISVILYYTNQDNLSLAEKLCTDRELDFPKDKIANILDKTNKNNLEQALSLIELVKQGELSPDSIPDILDANISGSEVRNLIHTMGRDKAAALSKSDFVIAAKLVPLYNKQNINEIPLSEKRSVVRNLVACNIDMFNISDELKQDFPLIPKNQEEYCSILPSLVKSLGIETNTLSQAQTDNVHSALQKLSSSLASVPDNEFETLSVSQQYSKSDFIKDSFDILMYLSPQERQKVYDYFGFELYRNKNGTQVDDKSYHSFSIAGYPVNLNNGKKLAQITDPLTKQAVEILRPFVIKFSENNPVSCSNDKLNNSLNTLVEAFPELRAMIDKTQHQTHEFDFFKHSLKVMQKVVQNPQFKNLNDSDKNIMLLASFLHDINKREGSIDQVHADESSFDAFFISNKLNLTKDEKIKLFSLIKHHEWLAFVNNSKLSDEQKLKRQRSVAFDLQYDNLFTLANILTQADLKSVKADDTFFNRFSSDFISHSEKIKRLISELKATQPLLPVTQFPKASTINKAVTTVNADGSTNIKGVYKDKSGLIILKYNEIEDWEKIGFPKGSVSKGILAKGIKNVGSRTKEVDVETGNIKFFAHGLDYENQLANFDAFALPDSDALLSVSYAERPESKYRFFRPQGVLLNTDAKYVHGGGNTDSGSGCKKTVQIFKEDYAFDGSDRHSDRTYVSELIKGALNLTDEQYADFVLRNANKPMSEIEPEEGRNKIIQALASINSNTRKGNREYNEMYITNPIVMAAFAYSPTGSVGDVIPFVHNQQKFLQNYALDNDLPFVVLGD